MSNNTQMAAKLMAAEKKLQEQSARIHAILRTADPNQWAIHPKTQKLQALVAAQEANLQELAKQHNAFVEAAQAREAETQKALQALSQQLKQLVTDRDELLRQRQQWIELPAVRERLIAEKKALKAKLISALDKEISVLQAKETPNNDTPQ